MAARRAFAASIAFCVLLASTPVLAQASGASLVVRSGPVLATDNRPRPLDFTAPQGDLRQPGEPRRNGLIAAYRVDENLQIGVGRFTVPEIARPRTYTEFERQPHGARARDRGIAAVGISLRF